MEINTNTLVRHDLRPDEYVYLYCIQHPPKNMVRIVVSLKDLEKRGWIDFHKHTELPILSDKAKALLSGNSPQYIQKIKAECKDVPNWIELYRGLFPVKNNAKRMLRGSRISCVNRMKAFIEEHSRAKQVITKDLIMDATKIYLSREARNNYMYTKSADYFVYKGNKHDSLLLTYISSILENNVKVEDINKGGMTDDI
jgi:hypothetical protein